MIRILVAEDEPAAARYLQNLVADSGVEVELVAISHDGAEAWRAFQTLGADGILTDIRMPGSDGLELARRILEVSPATNVAIVSGYQEFDYARSALSLGVQEYLLKPVNPDDLRELLVRWDRKKCSEERQGWANALVGLWNGQTQAPDFPPGMRLALVRQGAGLGPQTARGTFQAEPIEDSGLWRIAGRDDRESVLIADADRISQDRFEVLVREFSETSTVQTGVVLFSDRSIESRQLPATVSALSPQLDRLIVPGHRRCHWGLVKESPVPTLDPLWLQRFRLSLEESASHAVSRHLEELFEAECRNGLGLKHQAALLRQVILAAQQECPCEDSWERDWELALEQGLARVDSAADMSALGWELVAIVSGLAEPTGANDAPETHQRIRRYVQTHYTDALSLAAVCERFQVSQATLSRWFRRFEGQSFHAYLTGLRLDAAEQLMNDMPTLPLKTVAASVGYPDPFHFSRAFKAVKGQAPSRRPTAD